MTTRKTRRFRPALEVLEDRQLLSGITAVLEPNNTLQIEGSPSASSSITVVQSNYDQIRVLNSFTNSYVNIKLSNGTEVPYVKAETLSGIDVNVNSGLNNIVNVGIRAKGDTGPLYNFTKPVVVQGGTGNDILQDWLYPNCTLNGGGGIDKFWSPPTLRSVVFSEPYDPNTWALPGPNPRAVGNDSAAASYTDIDQGPNNNCAFLAALSSDALTNTNLRGRITYQGGDNYTVQLFNSSGKPVQEKVTFNGTWTNTDPSEPQAGEYWTILYWRAYKQLYNGNPPTSGTAAWSALTGQNATPQEIKQPSSAASQQAAAKNIQAALATGNKGVTVLTTGNQDSDPTKSLGPGLQFWHWYTVVKMTTGSNPQVTLRNPQGYNDTRHGPTLSPNGTLPNGDFSGGEFTVPWSSVAPYLTEYDTAVTGTVLSGGGGGSGGGSSGGGSGGGSGSGGSSSNGTVQLLDGPSISTFAGVGFAENAVAGVTGMLNGYQDTTRSDFHALINWGDGSGWTTANLAPGQSATSPFLVKGSHIYQSAGTYSVEVEAFGPGGVSVTQLTDTAYVAQMPSGLPGSAPTAPATSLPPSDVSVQLLDGPSISTFAGVGFAQNAVAGVTGMLNGYQDTTRSDFHALINWGDGSGWTTANLAPGQTGTSPFIVKGSHVYHSAGTYHIVVYATGADGTSVTQLTDTAYVAQMPSGLPGTVPTPPATSLPPSDVSVQLLDGPSISTFAGVGFTQNAVAGVTGMLNGYQDTTMSDFHALINWGDSSGWTTATIVRGQSGSTAFVVKGSHVYSSPGTYDIVVYATGPDGTSVTQLTDTAYVQSDSTGVA